MPTSAQSFLATFTTLQTAIDSLARMVDDLRSILETGICQVNLNAEKPVEDPLDEAISKISGETTDLRKRVDENLRCSYERSLSALQNLLKHQSEVLDKEVLVRQK